MNVKEKARNAVMTVKKKALPVIASATMAMSLVAVNAFAVEGDTSSTGMYTTLANAFKDGAGAMADGIAIIFGAVIPVGVGIIGLYSALGAGKKILAKLTS